MPRLVCMEDKPTKPGYAALRKYRGSRPQAEYFLTVNLRHRGNGLESVRCADAVRAEWDNLEKGGLWLGRTAVVMPDHIHLLIRLGESAHLSECLRLFKGRLSGFLRSAGLQWQAGFFEHQLREVDDLHQVFFYISLNPYRAGLINADQSWPGYYCTAEDWSWFGKLTNESMPPPEWLK